jgi:gamma-glutamyl hercynylcysteine S-oxide synthase
MSAPIRQFQISALFSGTLHAAREETDKLFALIRPGYLHERPIPYRHRMIFYLGHLEAFDWNQLGIWNLAERSFHPSFDKLFEAGIDPDSSGLPMDTPADWPCVDEVLDYCRRARKEVDRLLPLASPEVVHMAIEHRLMHAETLAYLLHNMPSSQKTGPPTGPPPQSIDSRATALEIPAGLATLGQDPCEFGWDNEFDRHQVPVPAFLMDKYNVTNGDFLQFVEEGAKPPHYWMHQNGKWLLRGMFGLMPLPPNWPVFVTHEEAAAYATWKHKKLPTEPQFHRAAYGTRSGAETRYPWGNISPAGAHGNFDFHRWDPIPVEACPAGDSTFGVSQLVGNGWEWTSTLFHPFPGFQARPNYPGYSANFFDSEHYVLKGASARTAACFLRRSFRNWFRPDYPYAYATFRCVEN